jgi:hypothetical protein
VSFTIDGATILAARAVEGNGGASVTSLGPTFAVSGPGTAAVEAVLQLPAGARPVLAICRNDRGPASVTLARTTAAPVTVGAVTSDASAHDRDGCENRASKEIPRSELIGPVRWPARADPRPLVLANYYPWYTNDDQSRDFGDNPTSPIDTSDPSAVARAIDLAAAHGIDGFLVEFEGTPTFDPRIDAVFERADGHNAFHAALVVDLEILNHRNRGLSDGVLDAALNAVARRWHHKSQLRVGDQPVIAVFGTRLVEQGQWDRAVSRLRTRTGIAPFVLMDHARVRTQAQWLYSTSFATDAGALSRWAQDTLISLYAAPLLSGGSRQIWAAPVSPGYDDTRLGRNNSGRVDRAAGRRYEESWNAALATLPDWVVITSWNEYYEQTHIVPGSHSGSLALQQTAERAREFHRTG